MRRMLIAMGTIALCLVGPRTVEAQRDSAAVKERPPPATPTTPACCSVVQIDSARSVVTARETSTGYTFRFAVRSRRSLRALKIGTPVWADFATKRVKLKATDVQHCCTIITQEAP
jgi:hypothetical protein